MARVIYFDCFSGAAGDMVLGALIDAGVPLEAIQGALGSLGLAHELKVERVNRAGIAALHVTVSPKTGAEPHTQGEKSHAHAPGHPHDHGHSHHHHAHEGHRTVDEILHLIGHSALSMAGKTQAARMIRRLADAEAAIHDIPVAQVHLHEVGAVDSIIDIVGAVCAFEWLGVEDIVSSPLNVGGGTVTIAHGTYPVPAPATLRLLAGVPMYGGDIQAELVTPTGALVVSTYAKAYGPVPAMSVERIGYGAGSKDFQGRPNVLRVVIGTRTAAAEASDVVKIECEIDDMSPQLVGPAFDRLLAAGALDVFATPIQMKKGRPGTLLTVLAKPESRPALCDILFRETSTLGVRFETMARETLDRQWQAVSIPGGSVRIKVATRNGTVVNAAPEFDDCVRIADVTGRPVKAVQADALRAWFARTDAEPR